MKKILISVALFAILIGILFIVFPPGKPPQEQPPLPVATELPAPVQPEPAIRYPIAEAGPAIEPPPTATQPEPAPPLSNIDQADIVMRELLALLGNQKPLIELFQIDHFIQRFVVTVDNLPRKDLPRPQLPVKDATGLFLVQGEKDREVISPYNSRRYALYIELADALDSRRLVDIYVRNYPLFQKAYTDLGYPSVYFNDRLVEVIDHLLETPEVPEPIQLERPGVLYKFADPELEARSAGQKILLRIGSDSAARIKIKLREIREQLMTRISR